MKLFRKLFLAAVLALAFVVPARAATTMLRGPALAVTGATNATPIVVTTAAHGLAINDWVYVSGVSGNTAANGVFQCSAVAGGTTCTLTGSVGNGAFLSGGTMQALGVVATGASAWYDTSRCAKSSIFVWSPPGGVSTVTIEATTQKLAALDTQRIPPMPLPTSPASILATITNPDNGSVGNGFYSPSVAAEYLRVNVTAWTSGTTYALLSCEDPLGNTVW